MDDDLKQLLLQQLDDYYTTASDGYLALRDALLNAPPCEPTGDPPPPEPPVTEPEPPPVRPPVDPPVDPPSEDVFSYLASLPFAENLPAFPVYDIPTEVDCDWIIENGSAINQRTWDVIIDEFPIGAAYRASVADNYPLPITIGVKGNGGDVHFATGWSKYGNRSVVIESSPGVYENLFVRIVGLTPDAEIRTSWGTKWGYVKQLHLFNIGLRAPSDSFCIRANDGIGDLIIDGCWWLKNEGWGPANKHSSGMHIDNWERLVWRRHQWRGKNPDDPGVDFQEHSAYLNSCVGQGELSGTWILENNLMGGNRTGFQIRPTGGWSNFPRGPIVVAKNYAHGYGWNNGDTSETFAGGAAITVWSCPNDTVFIAGNVITDAKYGCLVMMAQPTYNSYAPEYGDKNFYGEDGDVIKKAYVWDNIFENAHVGRPEHLPKRHAATVMSVTDFHWGPNELQNNGVLALSNQWGNTVHNIQNGSVSFYDPAILVQEVYVYENGAPRLLTEAEKQAYLVTTPPVA